MSIPERRGMCLRDWLQIAAWSVAAIVFYFNSNKDLTADISKLETRQSVSESKIAQETKGYETLLSSFNSRMDKLEDKLDRIMERRGH